MKTRMKQLADKSMIWDVALQFVYVAPERIEKSASQPRTINSFFNSSVEDSDGSNLFLLFRFRGEARYNASSCCNLHYVA